MVDAALIRQCADPGLKPAIVEKFIAQAGSDDPLAVTVRSGNRIILVPQAKTPEQAMALIGEYVGQAVVRVGITQYPAGLGIKDVWELKPDLVDACKNIRMGTVLFGKVYRIVTKWYGNAVDEAFEDAIISWQSGYFEGKAVFTAPDPGNVKLAEPRQDDPSIEPAADASAKPQDRGGPDDSKADGASDPNRAGMRIDLSGIGGSR
ncbi:TraH family protein [Agrobacterium sp. SHOUNA12C]|uniref:Conjugal transfer protein TraH n=1 Tax=Ensifer canadensis TaxID=555315 RepID=A0AAW4FUL7_9HYPH|nr:TraH family protein [Ensifer canadensis]MBM3095021.1 conjugal transfer protein TraH [Ensifer canadensis]MCJ9722226.1 TraH family protein [Agrobacterium sp. BETTINA12B]MCJ9757122.1 TraH family protein [Agrobacterium sp. SHOUNA12C]UBI81111.1 conjugal transfer protein TraH [Ensifer canadensis]